MFIHYMPKYTALSFYWNKIKVCNPNFCSPLRIHEFEISKFITKL